MKNKKSYEIHLIHEAVRGKSIIYADNYTQKDGFLQACDTLIPITNISVIIENKKEKENLAREMGIDPVLIDVVDIEKIKAEREANSVKKKEEKKMEELYTVKEVAKLLKCNPDMVYKHIHAGTLKALKLGSLKIRRTALEEFLEKYEGYDISDPDNIVELNKQSVQEE